ncbi:fatty acid desaturase [Rhodobacterales bacterium HKCCE2091]|nr:fatty acid desaturase [Rhodobacterales bacterium HKCCE2091]
MDARAFLAGIPPAERDRLTATADAPGLRHLAGHLALILLLGLWTGFRLPLWGLAVWPLGIALAFLFTLQHEATHRTPFRSHWLNEAAGHATGLVLVQPFLWFRAFHMAHHRITNLPGDPELAEPKPETPGQMAWHLSTIGYWRGKAQVLWQNAFGTPDDYVAPGRRAAIRAEARLYLAAYALLAVLAVATPLGPILLGTWLLPLATGFPVLRLYLLAEHGRCPQVANMFENTRTTFTTRAVRFLAWNMPYHAEHHAWPTVPFHRLPDLHDRARDHLRQTSDGYARFTADYVKSFGQGIDAK